MTLLEIVQTVCLRRGLEKPTAVIGSPKVEYRQMGGLATEVCEYLASLDGWQGQIRDANITTIAGSGQGDLKTLLADDGFQNIVGNKIFNRTTNRQLIGPVDSESWQYQQHVAEDVVEDQFRIQANRLYLHTNQPAGESLRFEYYSKYLVMSSLNVRKPAFTADTDTFRLDDRLIVAGLLAYWLRSKGMPYAAEEAAFQGMVDRLGAADNPKPTLDMGGYRPPYLNTFKLTPYS